MTTPASVDAVSAAPTPAKTVPTRISSFFTPISQSDGIALGEALKQVEKAKPFHKVRVLKTSGANRMVNWRQRQKDLPAEIAVLKTKLGQTEAQLKEAQLKEAQTPSTEDTSGLDSLISAAAMGRPPGLARDEAPFVGLQKPCR